MRNNQLVLALLCTAWMSCSNDTKGLHMKEVTSGLDTATHDIAKDLNDAIDSAERNRNTHIANNIALQVTDMNVTAAYLIYGDDESRVPSSNVTTIGRPVKMRLEIANGWKVDGDQISIGASERIETNTNLLVLNAEDMFKDYPTMPAAYGGKITLKAVITEMQKDYEYFIVSFRVWDKKGSGEIKGSYKLYIQ